MAALVKTRYRIHAGKAWPWWAAAVALAGAGNVQAVTPPSTPVEPRYEVVEALGSTDFVVDIAVDPSGPRPALVFFDTTRADFLVPSQVPVRLARYDRFARAVTTMGFVNGRTGNNRELRLAIDRFGRAHALAIETNEVGATDDALVYFGSDAQGMPIREQIDVENVSQIALTVDPSGETYVAYIKNGGAFGAGTLIVRRRATGTWTPVVLDVSPNNATSPSFAPYAAEAMFDTIHLAWAETTSNSSAVRHAAVSAFDVVTQTVDSNAVQFSLHNPQLVVDRFGTLEVAYVSRLAGAATVQLRRRLFNEPDWECIDTGCTLPTGPLSEFFALGAHAYVQGALNLTIDGASRLLRREGSAWIDYAFTALANAQGVALDRTGNAYTTGIDRSTHRDLFLARVGGPWESRGPIPFATGGDLGNPLDVASDLLGRPIIYARRSCCLPDPRGGLWIVGSGDDFVEHPLPGSFTVEQASVAVAPDGVVHLALYDGDQDDLMHAAFTPGATPGTGSWDIVRVDTLGDVGDSPTMLIGKDGRPMIAYRRRPDLLQLAVRVGGTWSFKGLATGVGDAARPAAVAARDDHNVHVSWFDEAAQQLRVTSLRGDAMLPQSVLRTEFVPTPAGRVRGRLHDLAMLGDGGVAVAHSDEIPGQSRLAYRYRDNTGQWFDGDAPLPFSAAPITRISLDTTLLSPGGARVAWVVGGRLHYGERRFGFVTWDSEDLGTIAIDAPVHMGAAGPLRITYNEGQGQGLQMLQRLEGLGSTGSTLADIYGRYDPYTPTLCGCFIPDLNNRNTGSCFSPPEPDKGRAARAVLPEMAVENAPFGDASSPTTDQTLQRMRDLFATTPAGRYYLQLFREHAPEIIRITLASPSRLLERTRTLSDLVPGMAALVDSPAQGSLYRFTPELIANSRLVVQGWRNDGSPALRAAIDSEFARTASFSQFTGMTFTEWFSAISVGNATDSLFADHFE